MTVTGNKISHKLNPNGKWKQVLSSRFIEEVSLAMACTQVPEDSAIVGEDGQMHFFAKDRNLYRLVDAGMADTATAEMKPGESCAQEMHPKRYELNSKVLPEYHTVLSLLENFGLKDSLPYTDLLLKTKALEEQLKQMQKAGL